jgi:hypothetical protein
MDMEKEYMLSASDVETHFWSKVWRCGHRAPCKKCCWPWRSVDLSVNWLTVWLTHAAFYSKPLGVFPHVPAHRFAYELCHGTMPLPTRHFPVCHLCHFGPCCNPSHLVMGSAFDNAQDRRTPLAARIIQLPDRRIWCYEEAYNARKAFYEAWRFQRVWAGPIPESWHHLVQYIDHPHGYDWPG